MYVATLHRPVDEERLGVATDTVEPAVLPVLQHSEEQEEPEASGPRAHQSRLDHLGQIVRGDCDITSLVPSIHCSLFFFCMFEVKKLAVETGYESLL